MQKYGQTMVLKSAWVCPVKLFSRWHDFDLFIFTLYFQYLLGCGTYYITYKVY